MDGKLACDSTTRATKSAEQSCHGRRSELVVLPKTPGIALMELSEERLDDPNAGIMFGYEMCQRCTCPHCRAKVMSSYERKVSWLGPVIYALLWILVGWMSILPMMFLWGQLKDLVHRCPKCRNVIAQRSLFPMPSIRSGVVTFRVGSFVVMLARNYVVMACGLICLLILGLAVDLRSSSVYQISGHQGMHSAQVPQSSTLSSLPWSEFLSTCFPGAQERSGGLRSSPAASSRGSRECRVGRMFRWSGAVASIREDFETGSGPLTSALLLRMVPSSQRTQDLPDVVLTFGEEKNEEVSSLQPGDWVEFEAQLQQHSSFGGPQLLSLRHIAHADQPAVGVESGNISLSLTHGSEPEPTIVDRPGLAQSNGGATLRSTVAMGPEDGASTSREEGALKSWAFFAALRRSSAFLLNGLSQGDRNLQISLLLIVMILLLFIWACCSHIQDLDDADWPTLLRSVIMREPQDHSLPQ